GGYGSGLCTMHKRSGDRGESAMFAGAREVLVVAILGTAAAAGLVPATARGQEAPNLPSAPVPALTPSMDAATGQPQPPSVLPGSPPSGLPAIPPPPP